MDQHGPDVPEPTDYEPYVIKNRGINIIVSALVSAIVSLIVLHAKGIF